MSQQVATDEEYKAQWQKVKECEHDVRYPTCAYKKGTKEDFQSRLDRERATLESMHAYRRIEELQIKIQSAKILRHRDPERYDRDIEIAQSAIASLRRKRR